MVPGAKLVARTVKGPAVDTAAPRIFRPDPLEVRERGGFWDWEKEVESEGDSRMFTLVLELMSVARRVARAESRRCWEGLVLLGREMEGPSRALLKDFWVGVVVDEEWRWEIACQSRSSSPECLLVDVSYLLHTHPTGQTGRARIFFVVFVSALLARAAGLLAAEDGGC